MTDVRPVIIVKFAYSSISGGYRRIYEILRLGKSEGIDYIIITNSKSCQNAVRIFPNFMNILRKYKVYYDNSKRREVPVPGLKQIAMFKRLLHSALFISRVAEKEDANLIVGPGEDPGIIMVSFLAGMLSSKPWTVVLQGFPIAGNLDYTFIHESIWRAFREAPRLKEIKQKTLQVAYMLFLLKVLEKTVALSASKSIPQELRLFNKKLRISDIDPPCGIDVHKINETRPSEKNFDAFYFGRFIPSKGMFDLPLIWKNVITRNPDLVLGIAGPINERQSLERFFQLVESYSLRKNIQYLGPLAWEDTIRFVKNSKVVIYPSREDSFSMAVLESLACGVPVVAYHSHALYVHYSECPAVRLFPRNAVTKMAKEVVNLIEDETQRCSLGIKSRAFAQKYTWDSVVEAELNAYRQVINDFQAKIDNDN